MRTKGAPKWTDEERAVVADLSLSNREVAQALGRSISAVRVQRWLNTHRDYYKNYNLGMRIRKPKPGRPKRRGSWTTQEVAIAADYKLSDKEAAALLRHRTVNAVRAYRNHNQGPGFNERKRDPYKKGSGVRFGRRNGGWTPQQLALAKDLSLAAWEVAERIKRTRHAVGAMRRRLGLGNRPRRNSWKPAELELLNSELSNEEISRRTGRSSEAVRKLRGKYEKGKAETDKAHLPSLQSKDAAGG